MSADAERCRALWQLVERDGRFAVKQVIQSSDHGGRWALLVSVPWCCFARVVGSEEELAALVLRLEQHAKIEPQIRSSPSSPEAATTVSQAVECQAAGQLSLF